MRPRLEILFSLLLSGTALAQKTEQAVPGFSGDGKNYATLAKPAHHEAPSAFLTDGTVFLFTRANADFSQSTVRQAAWRDGRWSEEGPAPFAPSTYDAGAAYSGDGKLLYFTSQRPGAPFKDSWNIWVTQQSSSGDWGAPKPVEAPVNSDAQDCCPTIAKATRAVYFSSERDGSWDIFRAPVANGERPTADKLPASINTSENGEWPSYIDPEERFLLFSSIRPGGQGGDDLYVAFRDAKGWSEPRNLGPRVNTNGFEDNGLISADGKRLVWSSRTSASSDIYEIAVEELGIPELSAFLK